MRTAYATDLAYIHHHGFGDFARNAAPSLLRMLRQSSIRDGLVVDLGCGSGIWARELTSAGYNVLGIDISPAMVALARKMTTRGAPPSFRTRRRETKVGRTAARFQVGSLWTIPLPACSAITCLGEGMNYLFDERRHTLAQLFRRVHTALAPGGVFIFDIAGFGRAGPTGHRRSWTAGQDWAILFEAREDPRRHLLTRRMITFRQTGVRWRRSEETHRIRLFDPQQVARELRRAGFKTQQLSGYSRTPFGPGLHGFLARRI